MTIESILFNLSIEQKKIYDSGDNYNLINHFYEQLKKLPRINAETGRDFLQQEYSKYQLCYKLTLNNYEEIKGEKK